MSFLSTYVKKHRLNKMGDRIKNNLNKLEDRLSKVTDRVKSGVSFLDASKDHAHEIADLIERVNKHFDNWDFTLRNLFRSFRFVVSISTEIFQIVEKMSDSIVSSDMTKVEREKAKMEFGRNLVWYVWTIIGPLDGKFRWIPFKKTIEKIVVDWLARVGIDAARDLFEANNKDVSSFGVNNEERGIIKAL